MQPIAPCTTFLFTDIEGSTRLWESEPTGMARALERHDRLCRSTVEACGGRLVKMIGDGLHAVFSDPAAAVSTALELQKGMAAIAAECGIAFKMRCGLHAGVAQARDDDYFGGTVNRAARIMAAAHGGQVLVSQAVVDSSAGRLPEGTDVVSLGRVRLRDLAEPVEVWQLSHPDLSPTFPPLRSLDSTPNNLPRQLTSFVGRETQIAEVEGMLRATRVLTLTGAGGCGKTRLAMQVAADMLDAFADGVWLVELASLSEASLVAPTLASVLGLKEQPGRVWTEVLVDHLARRHVLLVLDNAEHLLAACAEVANALLSQCPNVVILSTSRERLRVPDEVALRVPSLSTPDPKNDSPPDVLAAFESVRLFVERAQFNLPRFALTAENAPALASICHQLDGIPLALELAAARVRAMSVEEINQRLDQRFRLVTGGSRVAPRRQQTLRGLIDWSYDLLSDAEKALLCRVSIFSGGWVAEAAERVCVGDDIEEWEVLDLLTSLADKSLLAAEERNGAIRYRLLETVREYAHEQLLHRGSDAQLRERHLTYFRVLAKEAESELIRANQKMWLDRLETEHDNVRSALAWASSASGDAAAGLALAAALGRFWNVRGHMGEGRAWFPKLFAALPAGQALEIRTNALNTAGSLAAHQGDLSVARALHTECLGIRRALGKPKPIATSLNNLGVVELDQGDFASARVHLEESLAIDRELKDSNGIAASLTNLGNLEADLGNHESARAMYEEALAIRRVSGDETGIHALLHNMGAVAYDQADYATARMLYEESLAIKRQLGDRRGVAATLVNLGNVARDQGDHRSAVSLYRQALPTFRELGDGRGSATLLEALGDVAVAQKRSGRAARLWGGAERLREEIGAPMPPTEKSRHEQQVVGARAAFGDDEAFDASWHEGRVLGRETLLEYALEEADPAA